jgi:YggT family protein
METYTSTAGLFLINIILGSAIFIILLRLILQLMGADSRNPISQSIKAITDPVLRPARGYLPNFQSLDSASLVALVIMQMTLTWISVRALSTIEPNLASVFIFSFAEIIAKFVRILVWATIISALLSWFSAGRYHPITDVINAITSPLLYKAQKILPASTGIDFAPLIVIIALQLILILIVSPLKDFSNILLM